MARNSYRTGSGNFYSIDAENNLLRNGQAIKHNGNLIRYCGIVQILNDSDWTPEEVRVCDVIFPKFEDIEQFLPAQIIGVNLSQLLQRLGFQDSEPFESIFSELNPESIMPINVLTTRISRERNR